MRKKDVEWVEGNITADSLIKIRSILNCSKTRPNGRVLVLPIGCYVHGHESKDRVLSFKVINNQFLLKVGA